MGAANGEIIGGDNAGREGGGGKGCIKDQGQWGLSQLNEWILTRSCVAVLNL